MKKIYLLLLFCCLGNFAFATVVNMALSTPTTVASASVCPGATNVIIYQFTITGSGAGIDDLTGVSFTQSGTAAVAGDIIQYKLWVDAIGGTPLATSTTPNFTFTGINYQGGVADNYWITADIAATPTSGHTIIVNAMTTGNLTATGTTSTTGTIVAGGTQTLVTTATGISNNTPMCTSGSTITLSDGAIGGVWGSGTVAVASVNSSTGVVTPGGTKGTTIITYSCGVAASATASVNATPVTIVGNATLCTGGLSTTISDNGSPNGTWSSSNLSAASIGAASGLVISGATGNQGITTITYSDGCAPAATLTFSVNGTPAAISGNSTLCTGALNTQLSDNGSPNGTWSSSNAAAASVGAAGGLVTSGTTGHQGITTITYSDGCAPAATLTFSVNATPAAIAGNATLCTGGLSTTISDNGSPNGTWSSSNLSAASIGAASGLVTSGTTGNQGITTITYSDGCAPAATLTFSVNGTPAAIAGNSTLCTGGSSTQLSDNGSPNGTWSSSNASAASVGAAGGLVTSGTTGHQGITTITYSDGCAPAATLTFSVNATPAAIGGNTQMCAGGSTITLSDNGSPDGTWSSNTIAVASVNISTGVVTPGATQGTTTINYSDGCGATASITATVNATPAGITGNVQMCTSGSTITLANTSTNGTWSGGTAGIATVTAGTSLTGTVTPGATQGTTTISYSNGCGSAASITATVNASPAAIGGNSQMCAGGSTITLTNTSTNGTWSGGTASIATVTVGSYTGTVTPGATQGTTTISYSNGCGIATSVTATVNALPAPIAGNTALCANGSSTTLSNSSTNGTWSGSVPGVATVNSHTGLVTSGLTAGDVTISYTNGCSPAATVTVTVNALPTIHTFTGGGAYCAGDTGVHVGLTLSDPGISYQLYNGSTAVGSAVAGTGADIDFGLYTTPGLYHAIATNTVTLCTNYLTGITISINPLPDTFTITGGGSFCATGPGVHVGLDKSAIGVNYQLYVGSSPTGSAMAGTGSALDFGAQTTGGVYTVIGSNAITLCPITMAGTATVTVLPLPTAETVTGGGAYCAEDTGVHVGLNNSQAGIQYQLYRGGSPVGTAHTGTGAALDFGLQTIGGVYTAIATNPSTTCNTMMTGSVTVTVNPLPTVYNVTGGGSYCAGGTGVLIGLSGSNTGIRYQLYNHAVAVGSPLNGTGSVLNFGSMTDTGTYMVVATDTTTHCTSAMNGSEVVTITPVVVPQLMISINEGDGDTICVGLPATFTAQTLNGGVTPHYQWNVNNINVGANDSTYTYLPSGEDLIAVTMISSAACAMPDTLHDTMRIQSVLPEPPSVFILATPATSISIGEPDTLTAIPTNCGTSPRYQWYSNGAPIAGATNARYISSSFTNHDSISVRVLTSGVCGGQVTDNSVILGVFPAGIAQVTGGGDIKLFPNPNKGSFTISGTLGSAYNGEVSVEVTDMLGQVVYKSAVMAKSGVINEQIQVSSTLANGMYLLNLRSEVENDVFHFVVEQ